MKVSKSLYTLFISLVATIGGLLFGFDSGVINGTVNALQHSFDAGSFGTGFSVASMLLGCALGALLSGNMADKYGRKPVMLVTAIAFTISAWGSGIATGVTEFIIYRLIGGFAVGAASVIAPTYISEVAPTEIRGRLLSSLQQLAIVTGLLLAFLSNYLISNSSGGATQTWLLGFQAWKWMFWIEIVPAVIFLFSAFFIPESPRYLVAAGKIENARSVLSKIQAGNIEDKVEEIKRTVLKDRKPKLSDLIDKVTKKIHPILWAGIGLAVLQQFIGINVVFYYGAVLWEAAGFTENDALLINVLSGSVNICSTLIAIKYIDKIGRKPLLFLGGIVMFATLTILSIVFGTAETNSSGNLILNDEIGLIALIAANLYVFAFGFSWGPVVWVMLGEMFNNKIRGAALSTSASFMWIANFIITMTFPVLLNSIGLGITYSIYSFFALISIIFVKKTLRETKGIPLEDM